MREEDRVAIHEAMEQQTISIAKVGPLGAALKLKAGITTVLSTKTAVLAAANPTFGRYDDMRTAAENIDFQTTILSRFDLIFIVKDIHDEQRDRTLASHVLSLHRNIATEQRVADVDVGMLKKFAAYAREWA